MILLELLREIIALFVVLVVMLVVPAFVYVLVREIHRSIVRFCDAVGPYALALLLAIIGLFSVVALFEALGVVWFFVVAGFVLAALGWLALALYGTWLEMQEEQRE